MASYDYGYRSGYSNGKGVGPNTDHRSKHIYTDDECTTVIVDADGTQRTIVGCTPFHKPGSYVTKTETIIQERVVSPVYPAAYNKHSSPPTPVESVKEYRYADEKWRKPSSPVKGYGYAADDHKLRRPLSPVKGYGYAADDHKLRRPSSPVKGYGYAADDHKTRRPVSPVQVYGYPADDHKLRRPSSPEHDYPGEVGDFFTKVQNEASRDQPSRQNGATWGQPYQQTGHNGIAGYGDYNNKPFYRPNGNNIRNDSYDDNRRKNDSGMQPNIISNGGYQARPSHSTWIPPASREGRLSSATDDMEVALRFLKESAKSSSAATTTTPQYSPYSAVPKQDEYRTNAAKKNVRFN